MNTEQTPFHATSARSTASRFFSVALCLFAVNCGGAPAPTDGGNGDGGLGISRITGTFTPVTVTGDFSFRGVWGTNPTDLFVVGVQTLKTYNGMAFRTEPRMETFSAVSGTMEGGAVAVGGLMGMNGGGDMGAGAIVQRNAMGWVDRMLPMMTKQLQSVYAASGTAAWAVGNNTIMKLSGNSWTNAWTNADMPGDLYGIHGTGPNDVWAVGEKTQHWDGMTWTTVDVGSTEYFLAVWAVSPTDVWIAGTGGIARHFVNGAWMNFPTGTGKSIYGLWARASNDVWAVGEGGTIVHYNGQSWENATSGTMNTLRGIWGFSSGEMYAVGERSTVLKYTP